MVKSRSGKNPSRKRRVIRRAHHSFRPTFELESFIDSYGEHNALAREVLRTFVEDPMVWELMDRANTLTEERREIMQQIEARREVLAKPILKKLKAARK